MGDKKTNNEIISKDSLIQIFSISYTVYRSLCKDDFPLSEMEFAERMKSYSGQFADIVMNGF